MSFLNRPSANFSADRADITNQAEALATACGDDDFNLDALSAEGDAGPLAIQFGDAPDGADETAGLSQVQGPGIAAPAAPVIVFEEIVERYHAKVFQLVYRYIGDYDEASDLTQDTFVRAYGAWRDFRGESQVYTWLYRIAINLCHNQQKKLQRRRRVERTSLDSAPDDGEGMHGSQWNSREVADERPLPLQTLESNELRTRLHEALQNLPENYRTVIILRDIEGLTYEEIARITDSTLEAIKSRLFRARGAIRRLLDPYLNGPLPNAVESVAAEPVAPTQHEAIGVNSLDVKNGAPLPRMRRRALAG